MNTTHPSDHLEATLLALSGRRQRFGILPRMWIWNRREHWRHVAVPVAVSALVGGAMVLAADPPLWVAVVGGGLVPYLTLGVLERRLRRRSPQAGA